METIPAPGPRMAKFFETSSSPLVSVIVVGDGSESLMVSRLLAFFRAARSEPGPLSAALVTLRVAERAGGEAAATNAERTRGASGPDLIVVFIRIRDGCFCYPAVYRVMRN